MRDLVVDAPQIRPGDGLMRAGFVLALVVAVRRARGRVELRLSSFCSYKHLQLIIGGSV